MKTYFKWLTISFSVLLFAACAKKEEALTPSNINEMGLHVPQGNSDYDNRIVQYYNRWGTYVLYKFSKQEFSWQITGNDTHYVGTGADPNYINQQLDLLENTFFKFYQDSTLRNYLPVKFLLCKSLTLQQVRVDAILLTGTNSAGYETFAVNWGNSGIQNINSPIDSATLFRSNVNFSFLKMMKMKNYSSISPLFSSISSYNVVWGAPDALNKLGFLANGASWAGAPNNPSEDWEYFLRAIISNKYSYLTDASTTASDPSAKGILSNVKDVNGLIRRKYTAITNYYKTNFNIDLQRIGDGI